MKLAFLGGDEHTLALAHAALAQGHALAAAHDLGADAGPLAALAPEMAVLPDWESLLAGDIDAVIVARKTPSATARECPGAASSAGDDVLAGDDLRAEQLRRFAQERRHILVSHPAHPSMLVCYELEMIRRDTGAVILPYIRTRWHPAADKLRELAGAGGLGKLEQISLERSLHDRGRESVTRQFAIDVDLIRTLCGDLARLGAMGPGTSGLEPLRPQTPPDEAYANLGVQLTSSEGTLARWTLAAAETSQGARLVVTGSEGKATLDMPYGLAWTLHWHSVSASRDDAGRGAASRTESFTGDDVPARALAALERAVAGKPAEPTWLDAARCVELAENIERSLKRGRVIELHDEDYTEQGTFKGKMTSVGCGLLLASIFVMVGGIIGVELKVGVARFWPPVLVVLLAIFLILQLLYLLFPRPEARERD
jgi:predicted dehydrogenase